MDASNDLQTTPELRAELGRRLKSLRLSKNLKQEHLASKAGVSVRTLITLEKGGGTTLDNFLRVLRALGVTNLLDALAPKPRVSPMAMLRSVSAPRRASRHILSAS